MNETSPRAGLARVHFETAGREKTSWDDDIPTLETGQLNELEVAASVRRFGRMGARAYYIEIDDDGLGGEIRVGSGLPVGHFAIVDEE